MYFCTHLQMFALYYRVLQKSTGGQCKWTFQIFYTVLGAEEAYLMATRIDCTAWGKIENHTSETRRDRPIWGADGVTSRATACYFLRKSLVGVGFEVVVFEGG